MTKNEILEKYGKVELKFDSYYKYTFTYCGKADGGVKIIANAGGCSDEIYRASYSNTETLNSLDAEYVIIKDENDTQIGEINDY